MAGPWKTPSREAIARAWLRDEAETVHELADLAALPAEAALRVRERARALVEGVRAGRRTASPLDRFLHAFALSTREGVALMCLAEALLRIPDAETKDRIIRDKLAAADWERHAGSDLFVNASTWALMLTGRVLRLEDDAGGPRAFLERLIARLGEPVIREALAHAMQILGRQFVLGRTVEEALARARERRGELFSFDVLGEAARTAADAHAYFEKYIPAVAAIARAFAGSSDRPGVSLKLSGLHPRVEFAQTERSVPVLVDRVRAIAAACREGDVLLTLDAEEADRLDIQLDVFAAVYLDPACAGWDGFGLAVQAYQKRAMPALTWLEELARNGGRRIPVRLVKGAYWDTEIKRAQQAGLEGYPVFTRKAATDVSWLACARRLLDARGLLYPQFATHNALSVAAAVEMAGGGRDWEFQRLHGMGEALYAELGGAAPVRVYAPVGSHEELLPYLVRRLLENGANTSFVSRIQSDALPIDEVIRDPVADVRRAGCSPHPRILLPRDLYGGERLNSAGIELADPLAVAALHQGMERAWANEWRAAPLVGGHAAAGNEREVREPADHERRVGIVVEAGPEQAALTLAVAEEAFPAWRATSIEERAAVLERAADTFEQRRAELMALVVAEGGRTIPDALAEVREAVDFLRYYAAAARADLAPRGLKGSTGESNTLRCHGRGAFVCISPWNFPLAIFTGQVAAALAAGNCVVAKPAPQTPLVAALAVRLLHEAGIPASALQFLPGSGELGAALVADERTAGVAFTGSTTTGQAISRALAAHAGPIPVLIAETGGQNAMIVDSSALAEQVVDDVIASAFRSAGQRCSCLRVLFLQEGIADRVLVMLAGAAEELVVGDPRRLSTDVGPVIDEAARRRLAAHAKKMARIGREAARTPLPVGLDRGTFFAPRAFEIDDVSRLTGEVFGPIVHVVRYAADRLDAVVDAVNRTGFGLTLGIHSRIDANVQRIAARARIGNVYVNRNMVGAVVGVQPFGGERLSGTGPKAGGPHYLARFAAEQTVSVNTAAIGGNTELASLAEDP